jgi:hypothetical protein
MDEEIMGKLFCKNTAAVICIVFKEICDQPLKEKEPSPHAMHENITD